MDKNADLGNPVEVANRIRERRIELGLSIGSVAQAIGVRANQLRSMEVSTGRLSQRKYLARLANALAVSEASLLGKGEDWVKPARPASELKTVEEKSLELRKLLGERAKKRRIHLRLKGIFVSKMIGVSPPTLSVMETALWKEPKPDVEALWEETLKVPAGWLRNPEYREQGELLFLENGTPVPASIRNADHATQSLEMRQQLAQRAKQRRVALKMTIGNLASRVGVTRPLMAQIERCLRKRRNDAIEGTWETALGVPTGWLRDAQMAAPEPQQAQAEPVIIAESGEWKTVSALIRGVGAWLSRTVFDLQKGATPSGDPSDLTLRERQKADMFAMRYGVNGEQASTLEEVGRRFGLTRERVRQVVQKMLERAVRLQVRTYVLEQLRDEVAKRAPSRASTIEQELRGLLGESLGIWDAQRFASEVLGLKVASFGRALSGDNKPDREMVVPSDHPDEDGIARTIISVSRGMVRSCGAANTFFVTGYASHESGTAVDMKTVERWIVSVAGFEWISKVDGWFWFGADDGENRLLNVTRKVMAAAQCKVDVDDIHRAMARSQRWLDNSRDSRRFFVEAPIQVLTRVLCRVPWLACIQYNDFMLNEEGSVAGVLSQVEQLIVQVIDANGGVALKFEIDAHVNANAKVTPMAVSVALARSPCLSQPSRGTYAICGRQLEANALERAEILRSTLSNLGTNGQPSDDGWYEYQFELTAYSIKHKMIGLPNVLGRAMTPGYYQVDGYEEQVKITSRASGLVLISHIVPTLTRLGAVAGCNIWMRINPNLGIVRMVLVDQAEIEGSKALPQGDSDADR